LERRRARGRAYSVQSASSDRRSVVSDHDGNIWISNCANDTVSRYAGGNPNVFKSLTGLGIENAFDIAFNRQAQAFVTDNGNNAVAMLSPDGTATSCLPISRGFQQTAGNRGGQRRQHALPEGWSVEVDARPPSSDTVAPLSRVKELSQIRSIYPGSTAVTRSVPSESES
jgi:hypothetical protein